MLVRLCAAACCLLERGSKGAASDFCIWEREEIAAAVARGERARAREVTVAGGREWPDEDWGIRVGWHVIYLRDLLGLYIGLAPRPSAACFAGRVGGDRGPGNHLDGDNFLTKSIPMGINSPTSPFPNGRISREESGIGPVVIFGSPCLGKKKPSAALPMRRRRGRPRPAPAPQPPLSASSLSFSPSLPPDAGSATAAAARASYGRGPCVGQRSRRLAPLRCGRDLYTDQLFACARRNPSCLSSAFWHGFRRQRYIQQLRQFRALFR
jgi:hypothetical protein